MKLSVIVLLVFGVSVAQALEPLPAEVYGADPPMTSPSLSPDGEKIAYLTRVDDVPYVVVTEFGTGKSQGFPVRNSKPRAVFWSSPNHVILRVSQTRNMPFVFRAGMIEMWGTFILDLKNGEINQALGPNRNLHAMNTSPTLVGRAWDDNGSLYMAAYSDRNGSADYDLFKVNGTSGWGEVIARGRETTIKWVMNPGGGVLARLDLKQKADEFRLVVPTDEDGFGGWETVYEKDTPYMNFSVAGPDESEDSLIVEGWFGNDTLALFAMSNKTGEVSGPIFENEFVDVTAITDPYTGTVIGSGYTLKLPEQEFFELRFQRAQRQLEASFSGKKVNLISWSQDYDKFIVSVLSAGTPQTYYFVDITNRNAMGLANDYAELEAGDLGVVEPFRYSARDQLALFGYLTLPPGSDGKNLPLVVMPHGGPASRDTTEFDYKTQFLASRGYAVAQPQFRGSEGFGDSFEKYGWGEWGGAMQDDVTDAVLHLINEGIADPDRICIVGASYGGYAALAGATFTPDLYRCAASINGVADLGRMLSDERKARGNDSSTVDYWKDSMGYETLGSDGLRQVSPIYSAEQVSASVLIIHGKDDTVVPFEQGERMFDALEDLGKDVSFVELEGEDHWLSEESTRVATLKALETFLDKHIGSGWAPSSAPANDQEASAVPASGSAGVN